ncbi:Response regulator PleD [Fundidesulfovibrio magnetotacticus]|uniref:diguanylate cyclase n=2 Tax=Fundidesulfovibrio magnetotacticus TaxID=2730080 RepID=A0A6V8LSV6_9BACT|nr:Response regulator PleD [Fundidesulfovibrio magnetotacticus]
MTNRTVLVCAGLCALWCLAAWTVVGTLAGERLEQLVARERLRIDTEAEVVCANIVQRLAQVRSVPFVMAGEPSMGALLETCGPGACPPGASAAEKGALWSARADLAGLSRRLEAIRRETNLETLFVLNASGDCVAAGIAPGHPTFIGMNYASRQYFQAAAKGHNGSQFALSRMQDQPSLFFSSPVNSADGRFLGAVVARTDIQQLSNLDLDPDTFVTDTHGVVIKALQPGLRLKALPGADVNGLPEDARQNMYQRTAFETLPIQPAPGSEGMGLVTLGDDACPFYWASRTSPDGLVTVHVLKRLSDIEGIREDRVRLGVLASITGMLALALVVGGFGYVRAIMRHRGELTALNEILAYQARTDALTGCANRRTFLEAFEAEKRRSGRYGTALSMLSMDIDHFKRVNDRHGHLCGDNALRHIVCVAGNCLRATDLMGRMGGEEFSVLLPHTDRDKAALIAERVRAAVACSPVVYQGQTVELTVSVGAAQWRAGEELTSDDFFRRCDEALYAAKAAGRNRVRVADFAAA